MDAEAASPSEGIRMTHPASGSVLTVSGDGGVESLTWNNAHTWAGGNTSTASATSTATYPPQFFYDSAAGSGTTTVNTPWVNTPFTATPISNGYSFVDPNAENIKALEAKVDKLTETVQQLVLLLGAQQKEQATESRKLDLS